jgi:DNA-binding NarL/FixJ family response regulator
VADLLAASAEAQADVILLDTAMPEALEHARALADTMPDVKVVGLGVANAERDVLACAEAGIAGYAVREASLEDLVACIEDTKPVAP